MSVERVSLVQRVHTDLVQLSDVFNTAVYTLTETVNSASLGAAYCAKRAVTEGGRVPFQEAVSGAPSYELANTPRLGAREI